MYELIQAGARTYYIECPSRMGLFLLPEGKVCLIDGGNDKDAGKKALKQIEANGWELAMVLNTHSHADHVGGNALLHQRTGCAVYAPGVEAALTRYPQLEAAGLYGGMPPKPLQGKALKAQPSPALELTEEVLPEGLTCLRLDGHAAAMAAFHTADDVWFLGDSVASQATLEKYHVSFLHDPAAYLASLDAVEGLTGKLFVPAHVEPVEDIRPVVECNRAKLWEVVDVILACCGAGNTQEEILKGVFDHYGLTLDFAQYALVGATVRSYLSWLLDTGRVSAAVSENRLLWQAIS